MKEGRQFQAAAALTPGKTLQEAAWVPGAVSVSTKI
jgi:hypothetical protein